MKLKLISLTKIVYEVLNRMASNGPSAEDLDKAVKNLQKNREQAKPNNSYWMNSIVGYYMNGINSDSPKNYEDILQSVKPADIQKLTKALLDKSDVVEIVFKPLKK
jgi:zinc protease